MQAVQAKKGCNAKTSPWNRNCISQSEIDAHDTFCNADSNVMNPLCIAWCAGSTNCPLSSYCKQMSLTGTDCNMTKANAVLAECSALGMIISSEGFVANSAPCTMAGINSLKQSCQNLQLTGTDCNFMQVLSATRDAAVNNVQQIAAEEINAAWAETEIKTESGLNDLNHMFDSILTPKIKKVKKIATPVKTGSQIVTPIATATTSTATTATYIIIAIILLLIIIISFFLI